MQFKNSVYFSNLPAKSEEEAEKHRKLYQDLLEQVWNDNLFFSKVETSEQAKRGEIVEGEETGLDCAEETRGTGRGRLQELDWTDSAQVGQDVRRFFLFGKDIYFHWCSLIFEGLLLHSLAMTCSKFVCKI